MFQTARLALLALAFTANAATALPLGSTRYVDEKSGYVVETRDVGGWLRISGRHPDTGKTFRVKVSKGGRVVGTWDGKAIDYVMGTAPSDVQLAEAATASGAGAR
ncbi:hypothetical protein ACFOMD_06280 [Sphingoaurantiacus capsulatus]|uniref:Uncharacterized protein n=1 Tax=Sphingoaurantiacus capsulatus TaxID=1771310 RepID=A0ABV7X822_9SPHN